jgi:hypothetical protein
MIESMLLAAVLLLGQTAEKPLTGIIAGAVTTPPEGSFSAPVQVLVLPARYTDVWNAELQKRLDSYWETFKPTFAQQREIFTVATQRAYLESTMVVMTRMRRELSDRASQYIQQTSPEGRFEFKDLPLGEYMVLAIGRVQDQDVILQETTEVNSPIPQFLQLKKRLP